MFSCSAAASVPRPPDDLNGNLLTYTDATGTTTYTWDTRNRLTAISGPGVTASFVYDGLGRRKTKTVNGVTTNYQYDGNDAVAETGGTTATHLRSLNIDEPFIRQGATSEFYHTDALGSTLALSDATGVVGTKLHIRAVRQDHSQWHVIESVPVHRPRERRHGTVLLSSAVLQPPAATIHFGRSHSARRWTQFL